MNNSLIKSFCLLCLATVSLSSCATLFSGSTKASLQTATDDVELQVSRGGYYTVTEEEPVRKGVYPLDNGYDIYLIKQQKEGYRTQVTPIIRERFNVLKLLDIAVPIVGSMLVARADAEDSYYDSNGNLVEPDNSELYLQAAGIGAGASYVMMYLGPWWVYDKDYQLPALQPLPKREEGESYLRLVNTELKVEKKDFEWAFYKKYSHYEKGRVFRKGDSEEELDVEANVLSDRLNEKLNSYGYIDSTNTLFVNTFKSLGLECSVQKIMGHSTTKISSLELTANWKIKDMSTKKVLTEATLTSASPFIFNKSIDDGGETIQQIFTDALEGSLLDFMARNDVQDLLQNFEPSFSNDMENWTTLDIYTKKTKAASVVDATEAVVTVKTKEGHGSGCIISEMGYIITNHHVVDDKEDIEVRLGDNRTFKAQVLRSNPLMDLALIKIDQKLEVKPMGVTSLDVAQLGMEVFAVGTPKELELGQTLSKGIISGKREIEERTYLQTDVSINGGNSGGALIDKKGQLLGIVNAKMVGIGVEGIGFAIPSHYLEEALKINLIER